MTSLQPLILAPAHQTAEYANHAKRQAWFSRRNPKARPISHSYNNLIRWLSKENLL